MSDNSQAAAISTVAVSSEPLHSGRISTLLYGGFIEVLDDLIPGMWAEMLNDRGFEGVTSTKWFHYTGEPNMCDREWDENNTWTRDQSNPFNGECSARITAADGVNGCITQGDLSVAIDQDYIFYGYFRTDNPSVRVRINLKALLPDGTWMALGSEEFTGLSSDWGKLGCTIKSIGATDRAVFELEVIGSGSVWADRLSLMPSDNILGWRKDVVEVIRDSKMGVIRFGGSLLEFGYKWEHSVGDRDRRSNYYSRYWGRTEINDVGIDEFLQFCGLVDAEPLMCLSFEAGWESARDLLEYCNGSVDTKWGRERAKNGHPEPYNIRYWQIGNEQTGEAYFNGCPAFFKALKDTDPTSVLIASDNSPEILKAVGQYMDYTCRHQYAIADLEGTEKQLIDDQQTVKEAGVGHDINLAITEWNITASSWGLNRGKMLTLGIALTTARYLNMLHNHSDFAGLGCRSNMTNSMCSGFIVTNPSGILKTPSYHVLKLYADNFKPVPVAVSAEIEGADISACMSEDGKQLTVFAVNSTDKPIDIKLDIPKMMPKSAEAVSDVYHRKQLDIMNHWKAPERVKVIPIGIDGDVVHLPAYSASAIECV